jgi:predicted ATPase
MTFRRAFLALAFLSIASPAPACLDPETSSLFPSAMIGLAATVAIAVTRRASP